MALGLQTCCSLANPSTRAMHTLRLTALLVLACFTIPSLVSCNTTAGLGRDMQKVGNKIEDTANKKL
jgi:entericidin A